MSKLLSCWTPLGILSYLKLGMGYQGCGGGWFHTVVRGVLSSDGLKNYYIVAGNSQTPTHCRWHGSLLTQQVVAYQLVMDLLNPRCTSCEVILPPTHLTHQEVSWGGAHRQWNWIVGGLVSIATYHHIVTPTETSHPLNNISRLLSSIPGHYLTPPDNKVICTYDVSHVMWNICANWLHLVEWRQFATCKMYT